MKNRMRMYFSGAALTLSLLNNFANGENCQDILWKGIHDELKYNNESQFHLDSRKILSMSKEERSEYRRKNEGALSVGMLKILDTSFDWEKDEKKANVLRSYLTSDDRLAVDSNEYRQFSIRVVNKNVVTAWEKCMNENKGISSEIVGDPTKQFILNLNFTPRSDAEVAIQINSVTCIGCSIQDKSSLTEKGILRRFSGVSAIILRDDATKDAGIVIDFIGAKSMTVSFPAIPVKNSEKSVRLTRTISAYGGWRKTSGDNDMNTNSNDRVPVRTTSKLVIVNEKSINLELSFFCSEDGGDNTTFDGSRTIPIYTVESGFKIDSLRANGGTECSLTGGTVGKNHRFNPFKNTNKTFWKKLDFRVDGRGNDDNTRVGVGGDLEFVVELVEEK